MNRSGMKTATSETLSDTTVNPICFAPLSAASNGGSPASMKRTMFSIITIASSTTNPVEMVSAINERLSRLKPARYMMPNVPMSESGNATLVMTVAQSFRRNRNITMTTSATVSSSVNCTSCTDARIVSVRSARTSTWTDGGNRARQMRKQLLHAIDRLNDVRAGLPLNVEQHGRLLAVLCADPRARVDRSRRCR